MRSGQLKHRLSIQVPVTTTDSRGTPTRSWVTLFYMRAELLEQSTTQKINGQGATDDTVLRFRTRRFSAITTKNRIIFQSTPYNVTAVMQHPRGRETEIEVSRVSEAESL